MMLRAMIIALMCLGAFSHASTQPSEDEGHDAAAYIQATSPSKSKLTVNRTLPECEVDDHVLCPDSNTLCHGEQCCPPVGDGGLSYPCPSAPRNWGVAHCQIHKKKENCLAPSPPVQHVCLVGAHVNCPDGNPLHMCGGSQCCPPAGDGLGSYPCPSAPESFGPGHCQFPTKKRNCLKPTIRDTCDFNVNVGLNSTTHAIAQYKAMFPHSSEMIHKYHDHIVLAVVNATCPGDNSSMRNETYPVISGDDAPAMVALRSQTTTDPCTQAIIKCIIDSVGFFFQVIGGAGLVAGLNKDKSLAVDVADGLEKAGPEVVVTTQTLTKEIAASLKAKNWEDAAMGLWKLITAVHQHLTLSTFFDALKADLSWWEWVVTGVAVVAQLVLWMASDGAAAVAELVIDIASAGFLVSDYVALAGVCR